MTSRKRLLAVLHGEIPDRVPATVHQWQAYHLAHFMQCADDLEAFRQCGLDAVIYPPPAALHPGDDWIVREEVTAREDGMSEIRRTIETPEGILTQTSVASEYTVSDIEFLVKNPEDIVLIEKYAPVPVLDAGRVIKRKKELGESGIYRLFTNGPQGSPWQDACVFCGTEAMIYHAFDRPGWVHRFLSILLEKKSVYLETALSSLKGVFDMIETGGGAASNTVISPAMFREFCLPYDRKLHALIHDLDPDIAISYHTCGGMMKILDLIPENGCDFSETLSPVGCGGDIRDGTDEMVVKRSLGSRVKLMGGVNQIQALTYGGRDDIFRDVKRAFDGYGAGGGYIMMPSDHFFHAPRENMFFYAEAVRELCRYA